MLNYLDNFTDGLVRDAALSDIIKQMAWQNPHDAINLFDSLPTGVASRSSVEAIASALAQTDPQAAMDWIASLQDGAAKQKAIENVGVVLAKYEPLAAIDYAQMLRLGALQNTLVSQGLQNMTSMDVAGAIERVQSHLFVSHATFTCLLPPKIYCQSSSYRPDM